MYFWFMLFYIALIFNNGAAETRTLVFGNGTKKIQKFVFDHITLGHSGILLRWKPCYMMPNDDQKKHFRIGTRIKDSKNDNVVFFKPLQYSSFNFQNGITIVSFDEQYNSSLCACKISSLKENTFYEIIIQQYPKHAKNESNKEVEYSLVIKTNQKTKTKPAKPDFMIEYMKYKELYNVIIYWLPCVEDKVKNCHGNEAGTHFAVKVRRLDRREEYRFEHHSYEMLFMFFFISGTPYEITVISINGDFETESDPQEFIIKPTMSAVTSVKVNSYPNASILVSWKPPKQALENVNKYFVAIVNNSFTAHNLFECIAFVNLTDSNWIDEEKKERQRFSEFTTNKTKKLFDKPKYQLRPGETYIFFIVPMGPDSLGIETRVKYTIPVDDTNN